MSGIDDSLIRSIVQSMKAVANHGSWDGRSMTPYFRRCRRVIPSPPMIIVFSRDTGYHTSGWWKNPDFERCYHLSLSFKDPGTWKAVPQDKKVAHQLVELFYGRAKRWVWAEPPYSKEGKEDDVWHYRLFCDPGWNPIKPRGEVYSRELTEAGWKSFSDVEADRVADEIERGERSVR